MIRRNNNKKKKIKVNHLLREEKLINLIFKSRMESIMSLEVLLNEFYHHSTSNFRKKEIERILREFQEHEHSWQIILQNLTLSMNNQYLFFFSVSTLEVINQIN